MNENQDKDKKIILFPKAQKELEKKEGETLDVSNPVGTVYGVQQWINGILQGTSLYSSAAKQNFVLQTLKKEFQQRKKLAEASEAAIPEEDYKGINYEVY